MRVLMIFLSALCVGTLSCLVQAPPGLMLLLVGLCLCTGVVFLLLRRSRELRLILILFGVAVGILLGLRCQVFTVSPARKYAGSTIAVTGEAVDYSTPTAYGIRVRAKLYFPDTTQNAVVWLTTDEALNPGDQFTGTLRLSDSASEGSFYAYSEDVFLYGYGRKDISILPCDSIPFKYLSKVIAHKLEISLSRAFPADTLGFAMALTTGNRSQMTDLSTANLKASGIYHALALSGMHLSVLLSMVYMLVLKHRRLKSLIGIPIIIGFTFITGCSPSMVRATAMQSLLLCANLFRRERDVPTSLSLALSLLMAENPWCIVNWGLQLSFLSVIGITLFDRKLLNLFLGKKRKGGKIRKRLRRFCASSMAVTFSAMVMTLPLTAVYFGSISLVSPVTNLLTAPAISICFGGSLVTALLGLIFPGAASLCGGVISWFFRYVDLVAGMLARLPFAQLYTDTGISVIWLLLLYFMIFLLTRPQTVRRIIPLCCTVCALFVTILFIQLDGLTPSTTILDVGQGQCILLRSHGGTTVMIDCGGNISGVGDAAADHLAARGLTRLDLLILTHYDDDHVGGVPQLMQRIHVDVIALPDMPHENRDEIVSLAEETGTRLYFVTDDADVSFGSDTVHIFAPVNGGESNEAGLSVLGTVGNITTLITGDMDGDTERMLLQQKEIPDVDVLIAGHHGSKYSTTDALLTAVTPEQVVISVGDNHYGHPAPETLTRINNIGATLYRTDLNGTITIKGE